MPSIINVTSDRKDGILEIKIDRPKSFDTILVNGVEYPAKNVQELILNITPDSNELTIKSHVGMDYDSSQNR